MFFTQEWRALNRHRAAADGICLIDLALAEPERSQKVKSSSVRIRDGDSRPLQRFLPESPDIEGEAQLEDSRQGHLDLSDVIIEESPVAQRPPVDVRRALERHRPQDMLEDGVPLFRRVPEVSQSGLDALIGDLEISAA